VYGSVLEDKVKESNPSLIGNILQVAHNFNIISGCFSLHVTHSVTAQFYFLACLAIRKY
jgi:hypothetical protein